MANLNDGITQLLENEGGVACAVVDLASGEVLAKRGTNSTIDAAVANRVEVIRAEQKMIRDLGMTSKIEDILVTLSGQYHVIRPLMNSSTVFIYLVLDKAKANLEKARESLSTVGSGLAV
jgi:hypothetical protein